MASSDSTDSENVSSILDQLRSGSFSPILIGLMGPSPDSAPDRLVLMNPATQGMIVLRGDAATITEILGGVGSGGGGAPPASKAAIEGLKSVEVEESGDDDECSVCLDELRREEVKEMPCRHRFHGGCIEKWLKMHGSCPVCRFQMPVEEGEGTKKDGGGESREIWVTIAFRRSARARADDGDEGGDEQRGGEES